MSEQTPTPEYVKPEWKPGTIGSEPQDKSDDPGASARRFGIAITIIGALATLLGAIGAFAGGSIQAIVALLLGIALTVPGLLAQILAQLMNNGASK